jgi:hypothetical protein
MRSMQCNVEFGDEAEVSGSSWRVAGPSGCKLTYRGGGFPPKYRALHSYLSENFKFCTRMNVFCLSRRIASTSTPLGARPFSSYQTGFLRICHESFSSWPTVPCALLQSS